MNTNQSPWPSPNATPDPTTSRSKRYAALGVGGGLLAGGAIALMALSPGFTSAATDSTGVADDAVVQQDDSTGGVDDAARPEPGSQLREVLQDLVDEGTITTAQADAVAEHLAENRPERDGHRHRRGGPAFDGEVVAGLIGIDAETLRDELRSGSSIADLAEANGVDPQTVIDALIDEGQAHIDLMVESGRLTDDEAADMAASLAERITARVNGERPERGERPGMAVDG